MACPLCDEDSQFFGGTRRTELLHFLRRALWDCHKARQASEEMSRATADELSHVIRRLEAVSEATLEAGIQ